MTESVENVVVVAVRAEKEISKAALSWALTHIVRPGDLVTLLAVLTDVGAKPSWRQRLLWGFSRFSGDCKNRSRTESCQISASCSQMALQIDGRNEINVRIKVVGSEIGGGAASSVSSSSRGGVVAAESKRVGANWVVLGKQLKHEEKQCLEELQCNIVVMKGSSGKVLRLNLGESAKKQLQPCHPLSPFTCSDQSLIDDRIGKQFKPTAGFLNLKASRLARENRFSLTPNASVVGASSVFVGDRNPLYEGESGNGKLSPGGGQGLHHHNPSDSDSSERGVSPTSANLTFEFRHAGAQRDSFHPEACSYQLPSAHSNGVYWIPENHISQEQQEEEETPFVQNCKLSHTSRSPHASTSLRSLKDRFSESDRDYLMRKLILQPNQSERYTNHSRSGSVREVVTMLGTSPSIPPPLCSLCRHKAPVFGKPPREFTYRELEEATGGFSSSNFVAQGRVGCIHKGVLGDGQVVVVKQLVNSVDDDDDELFRRRRIEVLTRAQHRNVVMLVGFCVERMRNLLVYEYICNGSLDLHLHGRGKPILEWESRLKIAVGVARGLRYLHEDCRVGFVVHTDMRPNNILLTHDFEPLVGDFSLAGWQTEERLPPVPAYVAETFGYLAPEYIEYGTITEKSDVYAFGVVLLELITGRRAMDATQPKGQQLLVDWARPLLSLASESLTIALDRFLDPRLDRDQARFVAHQLGAMSCAASLCLRRDPQARPSMSKVLRVLEGNAFLNPGLEINSMGNRSGRISRPVRHQDAMAGGSTSLRFPNEAVVDSLCAREQLVQFQFNCKNLHKEFSSNW